MENLNKLLWKQEYLHIRPKLPNINTFTDRFNTYQSFVKVVSY